jgi:replicative DNA helicase
MQLEQTKIQDKELEEVVIGAILLDKSAIIRAMTVLPNYKVFSDPFNQDVYRVALELFENSDPIDILTVTQKMRERFPDHENTAYKISTKTSRINSSANLEYHCRILSQMFLKRELSGIGFDIWQNSTKEESDVFDNLEQATNKINNLSANIFNADSQDVQVITSKVMQDLQRAIDNKGEITGLSTGFPNLDKITNGLQRTDLIYLAARPSMGKTALFLTMIANQIDQKVGAVVFSLEMSAEQLTQRLISQISMIPLQQIRTGRITDNERAEIMNAVNKINSSKLKIIDRAFNLMQIKSHLSQYIRQNKLHAIYIDYLQLMEGDKRSSREQQISGISRGLKMIAKDNDCPVICLSQLSRAVEQRGGAKKPMLSDLRESGSIEQDADQVMFLYRPSYYGFDQDADGNQIPEGYTELICSKNRNGQLFVNEMEFVKECTLFREMHDSPF